MRTTLVAISCGDRFPTRIIGGEATRLRRYVRGRLSPENALASAELQGEFFDLIADPVGHMPPSSFRHRAPRHRHWGVFLGRVVDPG